MDAHGKCKIPRRVQILPESKERMRPYIKRWIEEEKRIRFAFTGEGVIVGTEQGGWLVIESDPAEIVLETWYKRGTPTQKQTLRALEALMYWSSHNTYPLKSEMLYGYHQVIMDTAGITRVDPASRKTVRVTTSCPLCTTADMNRFIDVAIEFLLEADLPPNMIEPTSEKNFKDLYREWYKWRSIDPSSIDHIKNWEEYCKVFPYDEFLCVLVPEKGTGQTQKIHIVSRGAAADAIDEPWNWIRGATSIHQKIHQYGWEGVLEEYPHLIPKVERARKLAGMKEIT
ncbi:MAG: hypothetical protein DRH37_00730 [Deltaproteobacteria bacterium]|nr:MAG: hypothetical protein DRH37_00730 [Deltaproteobacteria bacterium]